MGEGKSLALPVRYTEREEIKWFLVTNTNKTSADEKLPGFKLWPIFQTDNSLCRIENFEFFLKVYSTQNCQYGPGLRTDIFRTFMKNSRIHITEGGDFVAKGFMTKFLLP